MGVLGHLGIEVVLDHQHDGGGLGAAGRVLAHRPGVHSVVGPEAVHVNTAVVVQLTGELGGQFGMPVRWKVAQGILHGQHFFLFREHAFDHAAGGMAHCRVEWTRGGQGGGDAGGDGGLEGGGHNYLKVKTLLSNTKPAVLKNAECLFDLIGERCQDLLHDGGFFFASGALQTKEQYASMIFPGLIYQFPKIFIHRNGHPAILVGNGQNINIGHAWIQINDRKGIILLFQ